MSAPAELAATTVRVVVADDSPDMRMLLQVHLSRCAGLVVVGMTGDGRDAVRLVDEVEPDLVLLDIALPWMDGLEAAARIRDRHPGCRIVMLSAFRADRMADDARRAGADAFVEKAAGEEELLGTIARLFPEADLTTSLPADGIEAVPADVSPAEGRYHLLLDALEEGVLVVDPGGVIVDANFSVSRIIDVPTSGIVGAPISALGLDLPDLNRPSSGVDVAYRTASGDARRLLASARPLGAAAGAAAGEVLVSLVDVTDLRRSETRYRELAAALPDVVVMVCDEDLRFRIVTGGGLDRSGWRAEEIVGRTVGDTVTGPDVDRVTAAYRDALRGRSTVLEDLVATRTGSVWRTSFVPLRDDDGHVVAAMAVARDITEREALLVELAAAHAATAQAYARLEAIVDAVPLAIAAIDRSDRVTLWSAGAERLFGWSEEEVLGRPLPIVPDADEEEFHESRERERAGEPLIGAELLRRNKAGDRFPVAFYTAPVVDVAGELVETVGVLVDVRERKEAEQRVLDALEHAQRSADSRANLMQALAHDIRNPLTVIRGFSLTLQQGTVKEPGQQRVLLGRIAAQADSLLRLTTDLLGAARLEETGLRRVPTDLSQVVREAAAAVDTAGRPLAVDAAHVMAEVDAVRVRRIVENLIVNAVRHTPPSTPIWVRLEALDGDVLLTVDDAGTGVPPELREQIFDPFRKGPGSEGTGLGLSLVARFAAEHGGRAWVEERAGGGASFRVLLRRHATNPGG